MGCRTDARLAQSQPPSGKGFRGVDCERQSLGLHRLCAVADQTISLTITRSQTSPTTYTIKIRTLSRDLCRLVVASGREVLPHRDQHDLIQRNAGTSRQDLLDKRSADLGPGAFRPIREVWPQLFDHCGRIPVVRRVMSRIGAEPACRGSRPRGQRHATDTSAHRRSHYHLVENERCVFRASIS